MQNGKKKQKRKKQSTASTGTTSYTASRTDTSGSSFISLHPETLEEELQEDKNLSK